MTPEQEAALARARCVHDLVGLGVLDVRVGAEVVDRLLAGPARHRDHLHVDPADGPHDRAAVTGDDGGRIGAGVHFDEDGVRLAGGHGRWLRWLRLLRRRVV